MPFESSFNVFIRTLAEICAVSATVSVVRARRYASAIGSRNCPGKNRIGREKEGETERRISASNVPNLYSVGCRVTKSELTRDIDVGCNWSDRTEAPMLAPFLQSFQ